MRNAAHHRGGDQGAFAVGHIARESFGQIEPSVSAGYLQHREVGLRHGNDI